MLKISNEYKLKEFKSHFLSADCVYAPWVNVSTTCETKCGICKVLQHRGQFKQFPNDWAGICTNLTNSISYNVTEGCPGKLYGLYQILIRDRRGIWPYETERK